MFTEKRLGRATLAFEVALSLILVTVVSLHALHQMDYLGAGREHIRMTDSSRTAYVAKNIAEGRGYTANDLPAALVDFYAQEGKLLDEHWTNADRFPFGAYATAVLYKLTGSTGWEVGILLYNILFFVAFLAMLYVTASKIWDNRYAGLFAVTAALLHPYTFMYLYWKDGDMLFLSTVAIALFTHYYRTPPGTIKRLTAVGFGTVLAFLFLARPNLGVPLLLVVGVGILRRLWASRELRGVGGSIKHHLGRELLIPVTVLLWCLPFILHSMSEWGKPLFSANNLYQLPLGTRFGMGTDTWWKYTEPGQLPTLGLLARAAGTELISKFTSSWIETIRHVLSAHGVELLLTGVVFTKITNEPRYRPLRLVGWVILFAVITNLLLLPLYSYQHYSFRHYLAFAMPLVWICVGRGVCLVFEYLRPALLTLRDHVRNHPSWYLLGAIVALVLWNFGAPSQPDAYRILARTSSFIVKHWLGATLVAVALIFRRWLVKPPWFPRIVALMFCTVYACSRPNLAMKRIQFQFIATDSKVWTSLRERTGVVSSFALQGEVAWNTGRKNIPAPEWPMHIYSFGFDHQLEIEDVYIESADAMVEGGPFGGAAPGFEGYIRLQQYRAMPGYDVAFHSQAVLGYPKFRVKPLLKASTVYKLVDRAAIAALRRSPDRIELGDPQNALFTPHGWDAFVTIDGKKAATATNRTRSRYGGADDAPWEDSSVTFFLDERKPRSVELEVFVPAAGSYDFYWNLDLYAYDRKGDRAAHRIGTYKAQVAGWQKIHLDVPASLLKRGLNKLGFRTASWVPAVMCPGALADADCASAYQNDGVSSEKDVKGVSPWIVRTDGDQIQYAIASLFAGSLTFQY